MEGTDIEQYKTYDTSVSSTYYGNGCSNGWEIGGSTESCSSRLVKTKDDEDLSIGTYYLFQSATSGSGAALSTDNANSPDTFCPLGWQLPYSGTGGDYYDKSKSWIFLFNQYDFVDETPSATNVARYPLSWIYSGFLILSQGLLYYQGGTGVYWSETSHISGFAYRMSIWNGALKYMQSQIDYESPIRCVLCFLASVKRVYFYFEKQKSRAFVFFADPTRRRGALEARSHVTTCATKWSAKTPNVGFLPLQIYI